MIKYFVVLGEPKGKARPKFTTIAGHPRAITPKETVNYENLVKMEYHAQCGDFCYSEKKPVYILVDCFMPIPQSVSVRKKKEMLCHSLRPTKKPDTDNVLKSIADAINTIAYHDDSQIVDGRVRKFYSQHPRVEVTLSDEPINMENYIVKEETME